MVLRRAAGVAEKCGSGRRSKNMSGKRRNDMLFQKAAPQDVSEIARMMAQAQRWFAENGIDQWQNGYPNEESVRKDIAAGQGVVLRRNGLPVCYAALSFLPEPSYGKITGACVVRILS